MTDAMACPACGASQTQTGWGEELCPGCLLRLALQPLSRSEAEPAEAETDLHPGQHSGPLSPGKVLGGRYSVRKLLGRGGMGEVWRAFDLKLRVEVALKAMRQDLFRDEKRLEMLRQEVRAAREVVSPNVCRIFDLIEADGSELVSMEYVDGQTLLEVLQERGPLDLKEAQDLASQFLAGLEAIHKVGLVHRDVKPENIMVTRAGRVVVMDFGLARQEDSGAGTVAGTPAYMAPEQAAGLQVDARADVYSAGVVLAEMVSPDGIKSFESRQSLWEGVRSEPAKLPDTPWAPVLKRAVAKEREQRYASAHTLTRALEDVTLRVEGADDLHPYPGLASFTEEDAEYFFGREAEVEQMWRKLDRPHMLGLIGPSGAGKSSFLRAGLISSAASRWGIVRVTPGNAPVASLARVMAHEMAGDSVAVEQLLSFDDAAAAVDVLSRWRSRYEHVMVIVDQFEELFTLNPIEIQERFAELLSRLTLEADVFVLLSMRDDFLMQCNRHEALRPVFTDLMALDPPTGGNLRRALVQPATKCGYRFEDDELVDEMLSEVEGERGALPLLAFAAARLWEQRDRENGLLTRQAYQDIGGVGGALARHAETTIDRIGSGRVPMVREVFRNLVTAEGTRAVREWNELLSVFDESERPAAEEVLRELIAARLLTSYEVKDEDAEPTRRVEIIHESLLANWPSLVRWQTQDLEGAQLRDELRQSARAWDEHGRHDDRLWAGSAFREYQVWRERYPGGLTEIEEAFAGAMTSLATRRRRRRRIAAAAVLIVFALVAAVFAGLWRRSVLETRRAEASGLLSAAQVQLDSYPSATVAYATASLELSDSFEARRLALEALWKGPTAFVVNDVPTWIIDFTPNGRWLVQTADMPPHDVHIIGAEGSDDVLEDVHDNWVIPVVAPEAGVFATIPAWNTEPFALWSVPERTLLETGGRGFPDGTHEVFSDLRRRRMIAILIEDDRLILEALRFDGSSERLGSLPFDAGSTVISDRAADGQWFAVGHGDSVYTIEIGDHALSDPRRLEHIKGPVVEIDCDPLGRYLATRYEGGQIRLWDLTGESPPRVIDGPSEVTWIHLAADGSLLEAVNRESSEVETWIWSLESEPISLLRHHSLGKSGGTGGWRLNPVYRQIVSNFNGDTKTRLWPLRAPGDAEPVIMQRGDVGVLRHLAIHPEGAWLATSASFGLTLWPMVQPYPIVINRYEERIVRLVFEPDGGWLASIDGGGSVVRVWQLEGDASPPGRVVFHAQTHGYGLASSPDGKLLLLGTHSKGVHVVSLEDDSVTALPDPPRVVWGTAFSPDGRFVAAGGFDENEETSGVIRVWDVSSGKEVQELIPGGWDAPLIRFLGNDRLISSNDVGLMSWDLGTGDREVLFQGWTSDFAINTADQQAVFLEVLEEGFPSAGRAMRLDLESGLVTHLASHGAAVTAVAMDASGSMVVTGDKNGAIRVGSINSREPHLLLGNTHNIHCLAIDPQGRWIASASGTEIRLWPMPDLSKPPLHNLPRSELIAKLKTLTNLRVVRDSESATGWTLTHDPFPGWETVPTW